MSRSDLADVIGALKTSSALTEDSFLQVGTALQDVVEVLRQQATAFETLLLELKGDLLTQAFERLSWSAAQVSRLGQLQSDERTILGSLLRALDVVAARIGRMIKSVEQAAPLGINAKILAADLTSTGIDFSSFADEIARTLQMTRATLAGFESGLKVARDRVAASHIGRNPTRETTSDAVGAVAARLVTAVQAVSLQHERAAKASAVLHQQSKAIHRAVSEAIGALQIGDTIRQRLEHAEYAMVLIDPPIGPPASPAEAGSADGVVTDAVESEAVLVAICRLQSAQLAATSEQFSHAVAGIAASLRHLAASARALRELGKAAFAANGGADASFSASLEAQVGDALAIFDAFRASRADTGRLVTAVTEATASLCRQLRKVRALEADTRIMGLNAALKCARIGDQGRALRLIAQELCNYVDQFAVQANALVKEVELAAGIAASLSAGSADAALLISEVEQAMQGALATLRQNGRTLGDVLAQFDANGDRVTMRLDTTLAHLDALDRVGNTMRSATDALSAMSAAASTPLVNLPPRAEQLLEQIERCYTMVAEREIHDRLLGRSSAASVSEPAVDEFALEDMLF